MVVVPVYTVGVLTGWGKQMGLAYSGRFFFFTLVLAGVGVNSTGKGVGRFQYFTVD